MIFLNVITVVVFTDMILDVIDCDILNKLLCFKYSGGLPRCGKDVSSDNVVDYPCVDEDVSSNTMVDYPV
jgi:hypothetical protein